MGIAGNTSSLHYKDLNIALGTAKKLGLDLVITKIVKGIEEKLIEDGFGNEDISVLYPQNVHLYWILYINSEFSS